MTKTTAEEIVALETSYWDAMKAKDGSRAAKLSGETSLVTGASGVMSIPKAKMGKMTEEGKWTLESYAFDDVQVTTPAPDVAIIAYTVRQTVKMDGQSKDMHAADQSTWVRGADGWQCHAHSETFLVDQKAA
jgi:ketosteroid isomerase-like protein